jgi:ATP-dependent DNA ligase
MAASLVKVGFVDPMLVLRTDTLPEGAQWQYEVKLDGYRAIAFKSASGFTSARGTIRISTLATPGS